MYDPFPAGSVSPLLGVVWNWLFTLNQKNEMQQIMAIAVSIVLVPTPT